MGRRRASTSEDERACDLLADMIPSYIWRKKFRRQTPRKYSDSDGYVLYFPTPFGWFSVACYVDQSSGTDKYQVFGEPVEIIKGCPIKAPAGYVKTWKKIFSGSSGSYSGASGRKKLAPLIIDMMIYDKSDIVL